jgi:hypothetical protein
VSLEVTLARAAADVERGDLGKARDRLEGLLTAYPADLEIRRLLGVIYWSLQYPARAGQHWYLLPSDRPEMDAAKDAFAARYGGSARLMLQEIGYHGGIESVRGTYAGDALQELARRARLRDSRLESIVVRRLPGEPVPAAAAPWWARFVPWTLVAVLIIVLSLAFVGLLTAIANLRPLFGG